MGKINSRAKGHGFELRLIKTLKEMGWKDACSSRSESRRLDALGVDICYTTPFNFQCKAVESNLNVHSILESMPTSMEYYNLVAHKRNRAGTVISMSESDFMKILKLLLDNNLI